MSNPNPSQSGPQSAPNAQEHFTVLHAVARSLASGPQRFLRHNFGSEYFQTSRGSLIGVIFSRPEWVLGSVILLTAVTQTANPFPITAYWLAGRTASFLHWVSRTWRTHRGTLPPEADIRLYSGTPWGFWRALPVFTPSDRFIKCYLEPVLTLAVSYLVAGQVDVMLGNWLTASGLSMIFVAQFDKASDDRRDRQRREWQAQAAIMNGGQYQPSAPFPIRSPKPTVAFTPSGHSVSVEEAYRNLDPRTREWLNQQK